MIKKFHQLFESEESHLKSESFFKDYFQELIDDGYAIKIRELKYVFKDNDSEHIGSDWKESTQPREGYSPKFTVYLDYKGEFGKNGFGPLFDPKSLTPYIKICTLFQECYSNLISNNIELTAHRLSIYNHSFPTFEFEVIDFEEMPKEKTASNIMVDLYDKIRRINQSDKMIVELEGDKVIARGKNDFVVRSNTIKKFIYEIDKQLIWAKNEKGEKRYGMGGLSFDYKVITQKPFVIEFFNPVNIPAKND